MISGGSGTSAWTLTVNGVGLLVINTADAKAVVTTSGLGHDRRTKLIVNLGAAPFTAANYLVLARDHGFSNDPAWLTYFTLHTGSTGWASRGSSGAATREGESGSVGHERDGAAQKHDRQLASEHDGDSDQPVPATYTVTGFGTTTMKILGIGGRP